jgi:hypothetical protein
MTKQKSRNGWKVMVSESVQLVDSEFLRHCEEYMVSNRDFLLQIGKL